MTKKEKELYVKICSLIYSAKSNLEFDMEDYDCTWPKPIINKLEEALEYLQKMKI